MKNFQNTQTKITKSQWIGIGLIFILMISAMIFYSYRQNTGLYPIPFLNNSISVLPPELDPNGQTYEQVIAFITADNSDKIPYGEGYNCVDCSLRVWRNAYWKGIYACPIAITFYNETKGHMIIGFPTANNGDIFIEPQSDTQIRPIIGHMLNGKKVSGIYATPDFTYKPIYGSPELDPSSFKPDN
jgi:hypothetical protein